MLWRLQRRLSKESWIEKGLALGALGGLIGFMTSGIVHYNWGDSEVVMIFYMIMGLSLALNRETEFAALTAGCAEGLWPSAQGSISLGYSPVLPGRSP